jgi:myo-inositol 2-dehydrogenase / D-chiro-inositol 1-dehydrogenase
MPLGVGIVGAGRVTQAIHLPTLARLSDHFRVAAVTDVSPELADAVAARVGARPAPTLEDLLANPDVEVVAVCSPDRFHAAQVEAISRAGKRGILCEKPLASSTAEAEQLIAAVEAAAIPLVVGAMHAYDPAWLEFRAWAGTALGPARVIRSTIILPFNQTMEDYASQITSPPQAAPEPGPAHGAAARADEDDGPEARGIVLGLWIHDLPWIRTMAAQTPRVHSFVARKPWGAVLAMSAGAVRIDLLAYMRELWESDWRLQAWGDDWSLRVEIPPSYVHAGSATITVATSDGERVFGPSREDGYDAEWLELHRLVTRGGNPCYPLSVLRADLDYAIAIADQAAAAVDAGART